MAVSPFRAGLAGPRVERPGLSWCAAAVLPPATWWWSGASRPPGCGCSILDGCPGTRPGRQQGFGSQPRVISWTGAAAGQRW